MTWPPAGGPGCRSWSERSPRRSSRHPTREESSRPRRRGGLPDRRGRPESARDGGGDRGQDPVHPPAVQPQHARPRHPVPDTAAARGARRSGGRAARPGWRRLPGRLPQPAGRLRAAGRVGGRRARRDAGDRLPGRGGAERRPRRRVRWLACRGRGRLPDRHRGQQAYLAQRRRGDAVARGYRRRQLPHRGADIRPAARVAGRGGGVQLAARLAVRRDLAAGDVDPALRRRQHCGGAAARQAPRRARRRRRGGAGARDAPRGDPRDRRRGVLARGGQRGRGQRPDRVRRDRRSARGPAAGRAELQQRIAAVAAYRCGVPRARRHAGPHRAVPGRTADRRGHRAGRRAGVHLGAARHPGGGHMTAIAVRELAVTLDRTPVLRGVTCAAASRGWLSLIGPNGAGKSTLIRAAAGLVPYQGAILLDGTDIRSLRARDRARVLGYVPQEPVLPPDMTVEQYVLLGRTPHLGYLGVPGRHDRDRAAAAMERLDVARFAARRLARMSGGERQRVVLARALATEPSVLLLDEPTSMLDVGHQQQVLELVDGLRKDGGLTVLSTLHDLTAAGQYADELVLLHEGRVAASGPAAAVLTVGLIEAVYAARVSVTIDPDGRPAVTPRRPPG